MASAIFRLVGAIRFQFGVMTVRGGGNVLAARQDPAEPVTAGLDCKLLLFPFKIEAEPPSPGHARA
jgi:hypothetical protein